MAPSAPARRRATAAGGLWARLSRYSFKGHRISRQSLVRLCRETATTEFTLVVHSVDVDHKPFFPNSFVVTKRQHDQADLHTDASFQGLRELPDESFGVVLCTGLLEHVPDPQQLVGEFHRLLRPGGRLILSTSAVFPFHGAPDNFFHFTPGGLRLLFRDWSRVEMLRGSSRPFETLAILLQRINLQCDVFPPLRAAIALFVHLLPWLDVFVFRQFDSHEGRDDRGPVDSIMPAMLHTVVVK